MPLDAAQQADDAPPDEPEAVWIARHLPGVRALLLRLTGSADQANDLTQDVLITVLQARRENRLRDPAALVAYLHQTARNVVRMQSRKRHPQLLQTIPDGASIWAALPRDPEELYESGELMRLAGGVINDLLVPRDRDLIIGFYVHGLDKALLMERFGLNRDHFDRVISRARTRMRELINARMSTPPKPAPRVAVADDKNSHR